jgi:hypothetical protein
MRAAASVLLEAAAKGGGGAEHFSAAAAAVVVVEEGGKAPAAVVLFVFQIELLIHSMRCRRERIWRFAGRERQGEARGLGASCRG